MLGKSPHISDLEILLAADGELPPRRLCRVNAHLAECLACRSHLGKLESTLAEFVDLHQSAGEAQVPSAESPRALLKVRLQESVSARQHGRWTAIGGFLSARFRWAFACAAVLLTTFGIWTMRLATRSPQSVSTIAEQWPGPIPDKSLTPGATLPVTRADICRGEGTEETQPISASLRKKVFQEYRTPESHVAEYEIDFLITPGLGGANDLRNLWLEPYSSTVWNAHVKDQLEDRLHKLVCSGDVDLTTAQRDIATDWIGAYKKYFHTESPLSARSSPASNHL